MTTTEGTVLRDGRSDRIAKQVFILGAYGQNNIGDDALLDVFLAEFAGTPLVVNSAQPRQTAGRYGIKAVPTYSSWPRCARLRGLLGSDVVVFGGGSLLKEIEGGAIARLAYFARILSILAFCRLTGRATAMLGNGMGPLHRSAYKTLARRAANLTDLITVRDTASRDLLVSIGVQTPVHVTADPVFTLDPTKAKPRGQLPLNPDAAFIVVVPRYSLTGNQLRELATACDAMIAQHGLHVLIVPFQTGFRAEFDDLVAAADLRAQMRHADRVEIWTPDDPAGALALIGRAELVLSARLHGLIFAAMEGVPCVAVSYETKVRSFMIELDQSWASLDLDELDAGMLPAVLERTWCERARLRPTILARVKTLRTDAAQTFQLLRSFLASRIDRRVV